MIYNYLKYFLVSWCTYLGLSFSALDAPNLYWAISNFGVSLFISFHPFFMIRMNYEDKVSSLCLGFITSSLTVFFQFHFMTSYVESSSVPLHQVVGNSEFHGGVIPIVLCFISLVFGTVLTERFWFNRNFLNSNP